jgi:hypothetical protein
MMTHQKLPIQTLPLGNKGMQDNGPITLKGFESVLEVEEVEPDSKKTVTPLAVI